MRNKNKTPVQSITNCEDHLRFAFTKDYRFKRIVSSPVLEVSEDIYQPVYSKGDPCYFSNDWTVLYFRSLAYLKKRIKKKSAVCIVGTGGGLDALGTIELLDPQSLTVTDLSYAALNQSNLNIVKNMLPAARKSIALETKKAFLFNDVEFPKGAFDFIYENLPNLPLKRNSKTVQCVQPITASFYDTDEISRQAVPRTYADKLLSLHWLFLLSAKPYLKPDGKVLCSIGGRMKYEIIERMFYDAGYKAELIVYDFKRQNESASNLPGYAAAEMKKPAGQPFEYYNYSLLLDQLTGIKRDHLRGYAHRPSLLKALLKGKQLTASEACRQFMEDGTEIGHEVFFVMGTQLKN